MTNNDREYLKITVHVSIVMKSEDARMEAYNRFNNVLVDHAGFVCSGWNENNVHSLHISNGTRLDGKFVYDSTGTFQEQGEHPASTPSDVRLVLVNLIDELCQMYSKNNIYYSSYSDTIMNIINVSNTVSNIFINYIPGVNIMICVESI